MSILTSKSLRSKRMLGAVLAAGLGLSGLSAVGTASAVPSDAPVTIPVASAAPAATVAAGVVVATGTITGTVSVDTAGASLRATAYTEDGSGNLVGMRTVLADASGAYSLDGLTAGDYKVGFDDYSSTTGFAPEYYNNKLSSADAQPVTVASGATATGINASLTLAGPIPTARISGADRYATSVAVSEKFAPFAAGSGVVYVASGANYPDALSAGPAAAKLGGPLLLTQPTELPAAVKAEIKRLAPKRIVVVGGETAVSVSVITELGTLATVERQGGADRYETSRLINEAAFPTAVSAPVYVATGENFPDALSASAAAGSNGSAVVLVRGLATGVDAPTAALLKALNPSQVLVAGGTAVVSDDVTTSLTTAGYSVMRIAGENRYETSLSISQTARHAGTVYLAVGANFADALSGSALAGRDGAALVVVPGTCVPSDVLRNLSWWGTTQVVLLGGVEALGADVLNLAHC